MTEPKGKRKKVAASDQADVLVRSRRRCCICFGLEKDDGVKKGQIAHLDQDPSNNKPENLAFMCFDHHDEYDGTTSQSKGLTIQEAAQYRDELYLRFESWQSSISQDQFLRFLASSVTLEQMADQAVSVAAGAVCYGPQLALDVLTSTEQTYCDDDLLGPYLFVLDRFASWGWLEFEEEQLEYDTHLTVVHKSVCGKIANVILNSPGDKRKSSI